MESKTVIIGGGAAGLFCAINIKRRNDTMNVVVLEKQQRVLKKLLATGNGRCNYTNTHSGYTDDSTPRLEKGDFAGYYGKNPSFARDALRLFPPAAAVEFFASVGVLTREEGDGKCYPYSMQSSSVVDALRNEAERLNVDIRTGFEVCGIKREGGRYIVTGKDGQALLADNVVFACGGAASPDLGGSYEGYRLLTGFSKRYELTEVSPALVQVKTAKNALHGLQGIKIYAKLAFYHGDIKLAEKYGDLLFTDYGLSGDAVFALSVYCHLYKNITAYIDFLPEYSEESIFDLLIERRRMLAHLDAEWFLSGLINKKAGMALVKQCGVEKLSTKINRVMDGQITALTKLLKGYRTEVTGAAGFKNAQVTAGGIATDAFNRGTMESVYDKGIYVVGEMLDLYGDCGGFNLQWAWSSAYAAACHITGKI